MPNVRQRNKQNSRLLPKEAVELMTQWYDRNYSNPYPTFRDCEILASNGNITIEQVKQWFVNVRRRTQNQFRKQRTSYNYKRKSTESDENEENLEPGEIRKPKATKQKIDTKQDLSSIPNSPVYQNYSTNLYQSSTTTPYMASYYPNNYAFNNVQVAPSQYFDNSGHFVPAFNSSHDFNNSYYSNSSFDFQSPNTSIAHNYSNVQYNFQFNSPNAYSEPTSSYTY